MLSRAKPLCYGCCWWIDWRVVLPLGPSGPLKLAKKEKEAAKPAPKVSVMILISYFFWNVWCHETLCWPPGNRRLPRPRLLLLRRPPPPPPPRRRLRRRPRSLPQRAPPRRPLLPPPRRRPLRSPRRTLPSLERHRLLYVMTPFDDDVCW